MCALNLAAAIVISMASTVNAQHTCMTGEIERILNRNEPKMLTGAIGPCDRGVCDDESLRNQYLSDSSQTFTTIRLRFHLFDNGDSTDPIGTMEMLQAYFDSLNMYYVPNRIQFVYAAEWVYDDYYRYVPFDSNNLSDVFNMFALYSDNPGTQLNIFITQPAPYRASVCMRQPWNQPTVINSQFGIMIAGDGAFGHPMSRVVFIHEIAHALGLDHTQRGVGEVLPCGICYEGMNVSNRNTVGDFCADTEPTPLNWICAPPGGTDACSGQQWPSTGYQNIMGYSMSTWPFTCAANTVFTPQQHARMHCWLRNSAIKGWIVGATATVSTKFGPAPLTVNFNGSSSLTVTDWSWDFGDGQTANVQNPSHTFQAAGQYDVTITTQTSEGTQVSPNPNMIWVWGDTLALDTVQVGTNQKFKIDIDGGTHLPLTQITVPISWAGSLALPLDSIRMTGLRTAGLILDTLYTNLPMKQLVVRLRATGSNTIPTGNGPILSLWFRSPIIKLPGVNQVNVQSFAGYAPLCVSSAGFYTPEISSNGGVTMSCCVGTRGNVDNDPLQGVDIADLTTLVDHLFISFVPLACADEGNIDGIGGVDIGDLTALVDHLFISFTPLGGC